MSPSLINRIRANPSVEERVLSIGFDPDLHTAGIGLILATISKPAVAPPVFHQAWAIIVEGVDDKQKHQDVQFADSMVTEVVKAFEFLPSIGVEAQKVLTTIEGQRVYPRPDDTMAKVVGMGNDLIRLAQISGAVQSITRRSPFDGSRVYLPEEWKGQAPKETMHGDMAARLGNVPATLVVLKPGGKSTQRPMKASEFPLLPKKMGHALDAVCLAEFGLDRYHDDRWAYRW